MPVTKASLGLLSGDSDPFMRNVMDVVIKNEVGRGEEERLMSKTLHRSVFVSPWPRCVTVALPLNDTVIAALGDHYPVGVCVCVEAMCVVGR